MDKQLDGGGDRTKESLKNFESSNLYRGVYDYVQEYMKQYDSSHDFNHILRVLALAKHIMAEEVKSNPDKGIQEEAVVISALLHDVGDKKYAQPGNDSERPIETLLQKLGCTDDFVGKVATIVEHVSYSSEIKRPDKVKSMVGAHPELGIVQDADRLDAIGAIGIGRVFTYGASKAPDRGMQGCIDHFSDKLERIEGMMKTEMGKRIARQRTQRLQDFRSWWEEENDMIS